MQSEIEGGVGLQNLRPDSALKVRTQHTGYEVLVLFGSVALISGHPLYCPCPVLVTILGSTWGGSMLEIRFGRGTCMEFHHPESGTTIVKCPIQEIRECPQSSLSQIAAPV